MDAPGAKQERLTRPCRRLGSGPFPRGTNPPPGGWILCWSGERTRWHRRQAEPWNNYAASAMLPTSASGGYQRVTSSHDLFRMFDVLAVKAEPGTGVLGIQTTSATNHAARVRKLMANATLRTWLAAGNRAEIWSWRKDYNGRWQCRRAAIKLDNLVGMTVQETRKPRCRRRCDQQRKLFDEPASTASPATI